MQKKIIALAVAGLVSTGVYAQSNVTIYGLVDIGFDSSNSGFGNKFRLQSGQSAGNRIGFKGEEDLGGGNKFIFVLEQGFALDNGQTTAHGSLTGGASTNNPPIVNTQANVKNTAAQTQGAMAFGRQAFAGVKGSWGQFTFGRQYEPVFLMMAAGDPFAAGTIGSSLNTVAAGLAGFTQRLDNVGWYQTPNMSGFTVGAGYTTGSELNLNGVTAVDTNANFINGATFATKRSKKEGQGYAFLGQYANGPIFIGYAYHNAYLTSNSVAISAAATEAAKAKTGALTGTYDFGVVKVSGVYGTGEITQDGIAGKLGDSRVWWIAANMPFGKSRVFATYGVKDDKLAADQDAKNIGIGYEYSWSKRSTFYTVWGKVSNDDRFTALGVANGGGIAQNSASNTALALIDRNYDPKGLQMGVRHSF